MTFNKDKVIRTTKCFSPRNNGYAGGFPIGFVKYLQENGWWGKERCYLCSGMVDDKEAVRVDLELSTNPTHLEDARNTSLKDNSFDCVIIDPPYTLELAEKLYKKGKFFSSINVFNKEAERLCKEGGIIINLTYEIPKRIKNCDLIACIGIYQTMGVSHMRCLAVWKKGGNGIPPSTKVQGILPTIL